MKDPLKWRLFGFVLAITVAALLIAWAGQRSRQDAEALNDRLSQEQIESFRIADRFQADLRLVHGLLQRFQKHLDPEDWTNFQAARKQLDEWIDAQKRTLSTDEERVVLEKIDRAYDAYFQAARALQTALTRGATGPQAVQVVSATEAEMDRLIGLDGELLTAHQAALVDFIRHTRHSVRGLQHILLGALLALLALGAWFAWVVYREMIHPLRQQLIANEELLARQEKLASLGVLAAGVAHEIRNPLTAIKARLFTQHKSLAQGSPAARDAEIISSEINRLERIVKDFLTFARPAEPRLDRISTGVLFGEIQDLMGAELAKGGVALTFQSTEEVWATADRGQLKQVLINLVQNAAESINGEGGSVTLSARAAPSRLPGLARRMAVIEVRDTGKGIAPEIQPRLFDPFFTTKEAGSGLGLSIAARIVEKHGGVMEYQTAIGRGTTFGILLPIKPSP